MKTLIRAGHLATMDGPLILEGAIVFEQARILDAGSAPSLLVAHPDAQVIDARPALILPGLVNAHVHLELSAIAQLRGLSFVEWILELRHRASYTNDWERAVREATSEGIRQCIRYGVTAVGDITLNPQASRPVLSDSQLRGVSFGEVLGMAGRSGQMADRIAAAIDQTHDREDFRAGIEPHAPYSLDLRGYVECLQTARELGLPLSTHLAETPDEAAFLKDHSGPFRRLWDELGGWKDDVSRSGGGPIRTMARLGLLDYPTVLAHVNYVDDEELELLAGSTASVVYCPRTHANFKHPPHRFVEMLAKGINVAVGSDSTVSSGDLNIMEDLRLIHEQRPELEPMKLLELATTRGAKALGMDDRIGRLAPGYRADFCIFERIHEDLLSLDEPEEVWIGGKKVHP